MLKVRKEGHIEGFINAVGRVAQLVEHYLDMVVVGGSNPLVATIFFVLPSVWEFIQVKGSYHDE